MYKVEIKKDGEVVNSFSLERLAIHQERPVEVRRFTGDGDQEREMIPGPTTTVITGTQNEQQISRFPGEAG